MEEEEEEEEVEEERRKKKEEDSTDSRSAGDLPLRPARVHDSLRRISE
jgi:hypothetical protein